jgi:hypothetical protein
MATIDGGARVLLYGGYDASFALFDDTWIFDPSEPVPADRWQEVVGATIGDRSHAAMAPAELDGQPIIVGGFDGAAFTDQVHRWTGTDWAPLMLSGQPSARSAHVGFTFEPVADGSGNGLLVTGLGSGTPPPPTDTRTLDVS